MNCKRSNESKMTCKRPHKLLLFQSCFEAICLLPGAHRNLPMVPRTDRETYFFQTENYTALLRVKRGAPVSHTLPVSPVLGPPAGTLRVFRTAVRGGGALCSDPLQSRKSPPSSFPSITWQRASGARASSPPGTGQPLHSVAAGLPQRSAAYRSGAGGERRAGVERGEEEEEGRTDRRTVSPPTGRIVICSIPSLQHASGE